ncbi:MAG: protein kinase [Myxococcota bacterium]
MDGAKLQVLQGDPLIGSTFADRYLIEACIGEGGMGRVYRARHARMSRQFAIKVLFGDLAADHRMRLRFTQEGEAASRLSHPNVISVVDVGETPSQQLYLAMDYVEGPSLRTLIAEQAPFETVRAANLLRQLASGLVHAHNRGLIHRDFKPENIVVTRDEDGEAPKILDFGLARLSENGFDNGLTTEGTVMGTPAYMSPEHALGGPVDPRTDLFSLGVTLYEMLAGAQPFEGTGAELLQKNITAPPPPIGERVPGLIVDRTLEAMAFKLMAKRPDDRYDSARALLDAIAEHPSLPPEISRRAQSLDSRISGPAEQTSLNLNQLPSDDMPTLSTEQPQLGPIPGAAELDLSSEPTEVSPGPPAAPQATDAHRAAGFEDRDPGAAESGADRFARAGSGAVTAPAYTPPHLPRIAQQAAGPAQATQVVATTRMGLYVWLLIPALLGLCALVWVLATSAREGDRPAVQVTTADDAYSDRSADKPTTAADNPPAAAQDSPADPVVAGGGREGAAEPAKPAGDRLARSNDSAASVPPTAPTTTAKDDAPDADAAPGAGRPAEAAAHGQKTRPRRDRSRARSTMSATDYFRALDRLNASVNKYWQDHREDATANALLKRLKLLNDPERRLRAQHEDNFRRAQLAELRSIERQLARAERQARDR